jgi:hypothetical protein
VGRRSPADRRRRRPDCARPGPTDAELASQGPPVLQVADAVLDAESLRRVSPAFGLVRRATAGKTGIWFLPSGRPWGEGRTGGLRLPSGGLALPGQQAARHPPQSALSPQDVRSNQSSLNQHQRHLRRSELRWRVSPQVGRPAQIISVFTTCAQVTTAFGPTRTPRPAVAPAPVSSSPTAVSQPGTAVRSLGRGFRSW